MLRTFSSVILLFMLLLTSCKESNINNVDDTASDNGRIDALANPNNPFSFYGTFHNEAMLYGKNYFPGGYSDIDTDAKLALVMTNFFIDYSSSDTLDNSDSADVYSDMLFVKSKINFYSNKTLSDVLTDLNYSSSFNNYSSLIYNALDNYVIDSITPATFYQAYLDSIETELLVDVALTSQERSVLSIVVAIGKASFVYWHNEYVASNPSELIFYGKENTIMRNSNQSGAAMRMFKGDVTGALIGGTSLLWAGMATGAILGSIFPGAGTAAGAASGAISGLVGGIIGGGISGSLWAAFNK